MPSTRGSSLMVSTSSRCSRLAHDDARRRRPAGSSGGGRSSTLEPAALVEAAAPRRCRPAPRGARVPRAASAPRRTSSARSSRAEPAALRARRHGDGHARRRRSPPCVEPGVPERRRRRRSSDHVVAARPAGELGPPGRLGDQASSAKSSRSSAASGREVGPAQLAHGRAPQRSRRTPLRRVVSGVRAAQVERLDRHRLARRQPAQRHRGPASRRSTSSGWPSGARRTRRGRAAAPDRRRQGPHGRGQLGRAVDGGLAQRARRRRSSRSAPSRPPCGARRWRRARSSTPSRSASACVGERVEAADAVHRDAERVADVTRRDQADPQPGERPGPDADRDGGEVGGEAPAAASVSRDQRRQLLGVRARVDRRLPRRSRRRGARTVTPIAEVEVSIARISTAHRPRATQPGIRGVAAPAPTDAGDGRGALLGGGVDVEHDLEPVLAEVLGEPVAPLDHGDASSSEVSRSRSSSSSDAAEPVGVDVHQRRAADERRVHPGDDERRRGDRAAHAEALADALGERGLAGAEAAGEHDRSPARSSAPSAPARAPGCRRHRAATTRRPLTRRPRARSVRLGRGATRRFLAMS